MTLRSRLALILLPCVVAAGIGTTAAAGDGGPSPGIMAGWDGVRAQGDAVRYVTFTTSRSSTLGVIRVRDGRVMRYVTLRGELGVPLVAYDGTAGGLSHDRRTLVLSSYAPRGAGNAMTHFAVVRTQTLRVKQRIDLPGVWAFDAVSPDGATIYAVQYFSAAKPDSYQVRAIDALSGRVLPGAIADPLERDDEMRGSPLSRAVGPDGRWAYTLYGKPNGTGFIHALDTVRRQAVCIDLPWRGVANALWAVRMAVDTDGTRLTLRQPRIGRLAVVELEKPFAFRAFKKPVTP